MADTTSLSNDRIERMIALRRDIHTHPELAFEEHRTSEIVAETLAAAGIEVHRGVAKTGVVGVLRNGDGPTIGLRADMDALPIIEANRHADHCSTHHGVMHACGHDGHTVMLLAAAEMLAETRDFNGTVVFIFQPAEENLGGGRIMIKEGLFEHFPCDAIFALHNWPGLAAGKIAVQPGPMMASFDTFRVVLTGVGGHAAMPEFTKDPIIAASELVLALQTIVSRKVSAHDPAVLSVTQLKGGETYNVIPDSLEMKGTVRCFNADVRTFIETEIRKTVDAVCAAHGTSAEVEYEFGYPSTINTANEAAFAAETAAALFGAEKVETSFRPSMASEDFSCMLEEVPGAYIWLGVGEDAAPLHNPAYDFNDAVLPTGADLLAGLARAYLKA